MGLQALDKNDMTKTIYVYLVVVLKERKALERQRKCCTIEEHHSIELSKNLWYRVEISSMVNYSQQFLLCNASQLQS